MSKPAMQLVNLKKTIGKKPIIKGLDFEIQAGEVFGFLGPNGAGKTTTIRMMVGLIDITEGDVLIEGKSIKTDFKGAIQHVGAIVENPEMYPFLSGWNNLKQYARMVNDVTEDRMKQVISLVGLEHAIHEKVGRYSLGMRQRLGIAQALLHGPSILILDEPTNGLDPSGIREIRKYIRNLAEKENVAVIVSSHLLTEIELMCDRIGVIKNGELIAIEAVRSVQNDEALKEVFIEAEPLESAKIYLETQTTNKIGVTAKELSISIKHEEIPAVLKSLIEQGINIYGVRVLQATLEDKFFDLIGENTIE
ncbi:MULTISPECIES: ABC transporter ATP-binding protein [Planococcus]|uniref:Bacitracin ABC transporter ATP-binding protein n=2 Tax=Planococcus TaxID=1372 RepID=A0ABM5WSS8_9BACL|nr:MULTISPECIES: ABC transporter ATP-binding protein [Planococcus]ALS77413.1 bacitracin ABC transporter ATP-binding protein [Planococcus kocurii]AQU80712.1 bacitracin ABC transporter ATP-binding protein [Planococcus faecalis]KAA0959208.1 ABC transporter ATP-binding protein [Planococcus sp. ANT_H30]MDJ0331917.1 ABC transporter ATP-binding protein [Planococcus sp. S3-L1]OHX55705.1 bacitracin ABC transporter ATP-binding protein [Planococcus faecalis]